MEESECRGYEGVYIESTLAGADRAAVRSTWEEEEQGFKRKGVKEIVQVKSFNMLAENCPDRNRLSLPGDWAFKGDSLGGLSLVLAMQGSAG